MKQLQMSAHPVAALLALSSGAAVLMGPSPALASGSEAVRTARIEISDGPRQLSVQVALTPDDRPAELRLSDGTASYSLDIRCLQGPDAAADPVVRLDLKRVARPAGSSDAASLSLKLAGRVPVGEQVVLGQVGGPEGGTKVSVTLDRG